LRRALPTAYDTCQHCTMVSISATAAIIANCTRQWLARLLRTLRGKFRHTYDVHYNMRTTLVSAAHHAPHQVLRTCRHCTPSTTALVGTAHNVPRQVSPRLRRAKPTAHGTCRHCTPCTVASFPTTLTARTATLTAHSNCQHCAQCAAASFPALAAARCTAKCTLELVGTAVAPCAARQVSPHLWRAHPTEHGTVGWSALLCNMRGKFPRICGAHCQLHMILVSTALW
jgi:hypothetical protein